MLTALIGRRQRVGDGMPRLVEQQVVGAGQAVAQGLPEPPLARTLAGKQDLLRDALQTRKVTDATRTLQ